MAALMWTIWFGGTVLSLLVIYALLRTMYGGNDDA